jgi:PPOX class probable FMN-dependent enzyme
MSLAPWRSAIARSLHQNRSLPESRYFQLATLTPSGQPANRTVVFRGFRDDSNELQIVSDARSEKNAHLQQHPQAEICWYFAKSRDQFRISGVIKVIDADHTNLASLRQSLWEQLSDSARLLFLWPHPKAKRTQGEEAFTQLDPSSQQPPETFTVLLFSPQQVDYLTLKGNPQNRYLYTLDEAENWSMTEVNP